MISRRKMLYQAGLATVATMLPFPSFSSQPFVEKSRHNFTFCLNTSTIREQNIGLIGEMETAAQAGYDGIEIWVQTLKDFIAQGGNPGDIRKKAEELEIINRTMSGLQDRAISPC